jgi:hypothetical protein
MNYKVVLTRMAHPTDEPFIQEIECEGYAHAMAVMSMSATESLTHHCVLTHGSGAVSVYRDGKPLYTAQWQVIDHSKFVTED